MPRRKPKEIVQVKIRLHSSVVDQLEAAAQNHKISLNAEAAGRLGKSFAEEAMLGGEEARQRLQSIAYAFMLAGSSAASGRKLSSWINEPTAYSAGMFALIESVMLGQPDCTLEKCLTQIAGLKSRVATHFVNKVNREDDK